MIRYGDYVLYDDVRKLQERIAALTLELKSCHEIIESLNKLETL